MRFSITMGVNMRRPPGAPGEKAGVSPPGLAAARRVEAPCFPVLKRSIAAVGVRVGYVLSDACGHENATEKSGSVEMFHVEHFAAVPVRSRTVAVVAMSRAGYPLGCLPET